MYVQHSLEIGIFEASHFCLKAKVSREAHLKWNGQAIRLGRNVLGIVSEQKYLPLYWLRFHSQSLKPSAELFKVIKSNLPILQEDPKMNDILSNFK